MLIPKSFVVQVLLGRLHYTALRRSRGVGRRGPRPGHSARVQRARAPSPLSPNPNPHATSHARARARAAARTYTQLLALKADPRLPGMARPRTAVGLLAGKKC